jgi:hypothetical protein
VFVTTELQTTFHVEYPTMLTLHIHNKFYDIKASLSNQQQKLILLTPGMPLFIFAENTTSVKLHNSPKPINETQFSGMIVTPDMPLLLSAR